MILTTFQKYKGKCMYCRSVFNNFGALMGALVVMDVLFVLPRYGCDGMVWQIGTDLKILGPLPHDCNHLS